MKKIISICLLFFVGSNLIAGNKWKYEHNFHTQHILGCAFCKKSDENPIRNSFYLPKDYYLPGNGIWLWNQEVNPKYLLKNKTITSVIVKDEISCADVQDIKYVLFLLLLIGLGGSVLIIVVGFLYIRSI